MLFNYRFIVQEMLIPYTEELKKSSGIGKYIEVIEIINNGVLYILL